MKKTNKPIAVVEEYDEQKNNQEIKILLKKKKSLMKEVRKLAAFKEPVLMLIRSTRRVEFYEGVEKGEFTYTRGKDKEGNDIEGTLHLDPQYLLTFSYGNDIYKGYIADDKSIYPYPQKPLAQAELMENVVDKLLYDLRQYNLRQQKIKREGIKNILWVLVAAFVAFLIYRYWTTTHTHIIAQTIADNITNGTINLDNLTNG